MERKKINDNIPDYDFMNGLYLTVMKVWNIDKTKFRQQKIEKIMQKIEDDKRINETADKR